MNEPKLARMPVDAERVIRDLLDALKSLKTVTPPAHGSPGVKEEQKQSAQRDSSKAVVIVGRSPSNVSADPRPQARFKAVIAPVSDFDQGSSQEATAVESAENAGTPDNQIEAQSSGCAVIEGFCSHHEVIERLMVTPQELQALSDASLLGSLTCKQDVLFMLRQIRGARKAAKLRTTVPTQVPDVWDESIELVRREFPWTESDSSGDVEQSGQLRRFVVLSLGLVLMAVMIAISIEMC